MPEQISDALDAGADLAAFTASDFRSAINDLFRLSHHGADLPFRLVAIEERGGAARAGGAFTLLFAAAPVAVLPQAIYTVTHADLGKFDLFLVPIGPIDAGDGYEAVFT